MVLQISQTLRQVADAIDDYVATHENVDQAVDELLSNEEVRNFILESGQFKLTKQFANALFKLWEDLPDKWRRRLTVKGNPLKASLEKADPKHVVLTEEARKIIWGWGDSPAKFLTSSVQEISLEEVERVAPFDPIVRLMLNLQISIIIDQIRWRVTLTLTAQLVEKYGNEVEDPAEIANILVQSGLVSVAYYDKLVLHLPTWVLGGRKYGTLADELGGLGALIFLPEVGRSSSVCSPPTVAFTLTIEL